MKRMAIRLLFLILMGYGVSAVLGAERFPPPDFDSGHVLPSPTTPMPFSNWRQVVDVVALVVALIAVSWLALWRRSRRGLVVLAILSVLYFGFYRRGCICPVGAVQNVALALGGSNYAIPLVVLVFFVLPLATALLVGRTFCGGVCPLGALQDLVLLRPLTVPRWLALPLSLGPYIYLGVAVVLAATGAGFVICRYDPFVAFFRLCGNAEILAYSGLFVVLCMFVGRAYCRFLCPYGVLLGWCARLAPRRLTITPDKCIRCRLCEDSCPFGAIEAPRATVEGAPTLGERRMLAVVLLLLPVLLLLFWGAFALAGPSLARVHPRVRLADRVVLEERYLAHTGENLDRDDASEAFYRSSAAPRALYLQAEEIEQRITRGLSWVGVLVAWVAWWKILMRCLRRGSKDYVARPELCVACGRCFEYCPREQLRRRSKTNNDDPA